MEVFYQELLTHSKNQYDHYIWELSGLFFAGNTSGHIKQCHYDFSLFQLNELSLGGRGQDFPTLRTLNIHVHA